MNVPERYVQLALRLGKHERELVESYYGPPEVAAGVESEPKRDPAELVADAESLLGDVASAGFDDQRRTWFEAQLRSLLTTAQRLDGTRLSYREEVERTFEITPRWYDEDDYRQAHEVIDAALPGGGDLASRYGAWLEQTTIPAEKVLPALDAAVADLRGRAMDLIGLPDGEEIELHGVRDKRWFGFNEYVGRLKSRISVNLDRKFAAAVLLWFLAHEGHLGHHAEGVWKESALWLDQNRLEETVTIMAVPDGVVAEGIAEAGPELALGSDAQAVTAEILDGLGIEYDADLAARLDGPRNVLATVRSNVALMLFDRGASKDDACAYAREWALLPEDRARTLVESLSAGTFPGYAHCYPEGKRLCEAFIGGDPARFKRLLTEQLTPADLASSAVA